MKRELAFGILMVAVGGGAGCADLVGADFDVHARAPNKGLDAAADAPKTDGTIGDDSSPRTGSADATGAERPVTVDAALADGAWSDVTNTGREGGNDVIDAGTSRDSGDVNDAPPGDADTGDTIDANLRDSGDNVDDAPSADRHDSSGGGGGGTDAGPEPPPDGPRPPTVVIGGFVSLGAPTQASTAIELRGHIISNAAIRGVTSTGISIEGRIQ